MLSKIHSVLQYLNWFLSFIFKIKTWILSINSNNSHRICDERLVVKIKIIFISSFLSTLACTQTFYSLKNACNCYYYFNILSLTFKLKMWKHFGSFLFSKWHTEMHSSELSYKVRFIFQTIAYFFLFRKSFHSLFFLYILAM